VSESQSLHQIQPREQVGAQTGALYEFQYHQAAAEALSLLEGPGMGCVYCEWHDDYVTEDQPAGPYKFHQVKTRQKSKGPWPITEFFGLGRKSGKVRPVTDAGSIFASLWDHTRKFGVQCLRFVFVTDAGACSDMSALLDSARREASSAALLKASEDFALLVASLPVVFPDVTEQSLYNFLRRLYFQDGVGKVKDPGETKLLIANRILSASEVQIMISEAEKIGSDLVAIVRDRSHRTLPTLPDSPEALRRTKGLVVEDVLRVLSLSTEGYRQLQKGGRDSVVALSRLHRLCERNGIDDRFIPDLCRYKTAWVAWWMSQRDRVDELDYLTLRSECAKLLQLHSGGGLGFRQLIEQSKLLAETNRTLLSSTEMLSPELVLGLVIALAVESER
jgi:hypothetical protein